MSDAAQAPDVQAEAAPAPTWQGDPPPSDRRYGPGDWLRVARRGVPLGLVTFGCLGLLLAVRVVERPLFGQRRPVTPWITRFVCASAFVLIGLPRRVRGRPMREQGAAVANHGSWLDIFALNASDSVYFVAKSEVAGWPGIGWLARATGTLFIRRDRREAAAQARLFEERLGHGHRLLFFPEGTSTDGRRVLPFKPTLFAPFFADGLKDALHVQAITVKYSAPKGEDPRFYGWWGDMSFAGHLLKILAAPRHGKVEVIYHPAMRVAEYPSRKALAGHAEHQVRTGHAEGHPEA